MRPTGHIILAAAVGVGVATATGSPWALATTIGTGVFVDSDHTLDYYQWFVRGKTDRVYYLLHAWEHLALLSAATVWSSYNPLLVGATLGYMSHLLADQIANHAYLFTYSLIYRAKHRFMMSKISPWTVEGSRADFLSSVGTMPFGKQLTPWAARLLRRISSDT
jgi:membrane-bound metal-dependent hydrolase YbcI (DUF457 family)